MAWEWSEDGGWYDPDEQPRHATVSASAGLNIPSPNHSPRGTRPVRLVILHTAEGARTVQSLGSYFANPASQVSSHVGIDDQAVGQYVAYEQECWSTRSANPISDNAELCGFAAWTRDVWINQHMPMLRLAAQWVAERCRVRGIPVVKLTPSQVALGQSGVCGHVDWTVGMKDGTHTDPGAGFPWDVVMSLASQGGDDLTPDESRMLSDVHAQLCTPLPAWAGGITDDQNTPYVLFQHLLRASVEAHQANVAIDRLTPAQRALSATQSAPDVDPGLSDTDVDRIASALLSKLVAGARGASNR